MKKISLLLFFFISISNQICMAQSLAEHEWKNRVVLLFAPDFQNPQLQQQLAFFQKNQKGLKERKLMVYQITPEEVKLNGQFLAEKNELINGFEKFEVDKKDFIFILIGLDGGEKMRKSEVVPIKQLFSKIDRMPMRRAEIKNNK